MNVVHLLIDPPAVGAWNMAVDDVLMERAAEQGIATLRFYQWSPATLSLGYFQNAAERNGHAASRSCPLVRRSSGGGAILHDQELTYSLSLPTSHPLAADAETLYRETHGLLLETLDRFGVTAKLNERTLTALGGEPFLCFERRSVGDVIVGNYKICGSAQRRRKGAILQHGSILLGASAYAPELLGLRELGAPTITVERLAAGWLAQWRGYLSRRQVELCDAAGTTKELDAERIERVTNEKYGADLWTNRR